MNNVTEVKTLRAVEDGRTTLLRDQATVALRVFVIGGTVLAVIWAFLQVTIVTVAAFVGFAQAALLWPVMTRLARFMPRPLAVLLSTLLYLGVIAALVWFTGSQLGEAWPQLVDSVAGGAQRAADWFSNLGVTASGGLADQIQQYAGDLASTLGGLAVSGLGAVGTFLTVLVLALFVTVFALVGGDNLWDSFRGSLPERWQGRGQAAGESAMRTGRLWLGASAISGAEFVKVDEATGSQAAGW